MKNESDEDNEDIESDKVVIMEQNGVIVLKGRYDESSKRQIKESNYEDREIDIDNDEEDISEDSSTISEDPKSEGGMSAFSDNIMQYKEKLNENELKNLKQKEEFLYKTPTHPNNKTGELKLDEDYFKSPGRYNDQRHTLINGNRDDNLIDTMVIPNFQDNDQNETENEIRKNSFDEAETNMDLDYEEPDVDQYKSNFGEEENYIREEDI